MRRCCHFFGAYSGCLDMSLTGSVLLKIYLLLTLQRPVESSGSSSPIRLADGKSSFDGRIEVRHGRVWGTVCDDSFTSASCIVICKQLGLRGGICLNEDGTLGCQRSYYSEASAPQKIWIDELTCMGFEESISECQHNNWGETNCQHEEDAGCICSPPLATQAQGRLRAANVPGSCDRGRHRIHPFDVELPGRGRVEIQDDDGTWGLVCDDQWNDVSAQVFCACLDYQDPTQFRAIIFPQRPTTLPVLYDAVTCSLEDTTRKRNLWDCSSVVAAKDGTCDPNTEAAGVSCEAVSTNVAPFNSLDPADILNANVMCNGSQLTICYVLAKGVSLLPTHMTTNCSKATKLVKSVGNAKRLCISIPMSQCASEHVASNGTHIGYCYDVLYSPYDSQPFMLFLNQLETITSKACCFVPRNSRAATAFVVVQSPAATVVHSANSRELSFNLTCYQNENRFYSPLSEAEGGPVVVPRGEAVYCRVNVNTWDHQHLLVVDNCYFSPLHQSNKKTGSDVSYFFIRNRCSATDILDLLFYSLNQHSWGFRFRVPKFQGYNTLHVTCEVHVCNPHLESKSFCDRSCLNKTNTKTQPEDVLAVSRRRRQAESAGGRVDLGRDDDSRSTPGLAESQLLVVFDTGFGPLIDEEGRIIDIQKEKFGEQMADVFDGKVEDISGALMLNCLPIHVPVIVTLLILITVTYV